MASRIFLKIGSIEGSSDDAKHAKWIEVDSFAYNVNNSINAVEKAKGNPGGEACTHSNISVVKKLDQTSTQLYAYASVGKMFDEATIECYEEEDPLLTINLKKVALSNVSLTGDKFGESPSEVLDIAYAGIGWKFKDKQEDKWDLVKNEGSLKKK